MISTLLKKTIILLVLFSTSAMATVELNCLSPRTGARMRISKIGTDLNSNIATFAFNPILTTFIQTYENFSYPIPSQTGTIANGSRVNFSYFSGIPYGYNMSVIADQGGIRLTYRTYDNFIHRRPATQFYFKPSECNFN